LLVRFMGAFRLEVDDDEISFVVMNNTFYDVQPPDVSYDLKGTTEDRWVRPVGTAVLKDLNFADKLIGLQDADTAERVVAAIAADAEFLAQHEIMDYSLLLGVKYLESEEHVISEDARPDAVQPRAPLSLLKGYEPVKATSLVRNTGAKPVIYYLGIVDLLQEYTLKKKVAHLIKTLSIGWFRKIDTEPPMRYCRRFSNYFKDKVSTFVEPNEKVKDLIKRAQEASAQKCGMPRTYGKDTIAEALDMAVCRGGRLTFYHESKSLLRRVWTEEVEAFLDPKGCTFGFRPVMAEDGAKSVVTISCYAIRQVLVSLLKERLHQRICSRCDNPVKIEAQSLAVRRFTIKCNNYPDLQFEAPSKKQKQLWVTALESFVNLLLVEEKMRISNEAMFADRLTGHHLEFAHGIAQNQWWEDGAINSHFRYMDEDLSGDLDIHEVQRGWVFMNINPHRGDLRKMFDDVAGKEGKVNRSGLYHMLELLDEGREETIASFFREASSHPDGKVMTAEDLHRFLLEKQEQEIDLSELKHLIGLLKSGSCTGGRRSHTMASDEGLLPAGFVQIICSSVNGIVHPSHATDVTQDMTRPLTEYWLASSHNTYLEGNQLSSQSSVLQYVHVLNCGCRCIEIDSWDGPQGEPVVRHGYTATTTIYFEDVINAIADNSFRVSPYPIVISIDQNCAEEKQLQRQGRIMKAKFKDRLLLPEVDEHGEILWEQSTMPSPEEGKGKFIVKSRVCECSRCKHSLREYNECILMPKMKYHKHSEELTDFIETGDVSTGRTGCHCASFTEDKVAAWIRREQEAGSNWRLIEWHLDFFSRVYPVSTRVNSSNFDPMNAWSAGVQMVALNYQTMDKGMLLNSALFEHSNGGCGYVLKSKCCRRLAMYELGDQRLRKLRVRVLSGHRLPRATSMNGRYLKHWHDTKSLTISSPYVLLSVTTTKGELKNRTPAVRKNGFDPYWDSMHEFPIHEAADPELAFLTFEVIDEDVGERMAHASVPLRFVRPGVRWVPLASGERGSELRHAGLLVIVELDRVEINQNDVQTSSEPTTPR